MGSVTLVECPRSHAALLENNPGSDQVIRCGAVSAAVRAEGNGSQRSTYVGVRPEIDRGAPP